MRQLVFLHIGKTAGTSMSRQLEYAFPGARILHRDAEYFDRISEEEIAAHDIVQGHISYVHLAKCREDKFVFTFLRDPAERVLSAYHFLRTRHPESDEANPESPFALAKQMNLLSFLRSRNPAVRVLVENHQTYALGLDWRSRAREHDPAVLRQACELLEKVDFIGLTERFEESVESLFHELGVSTPPRKIHENTTTDRPSVATLTPQERDAIEELNQLDNELYRYAKRVYRRRKWNLGLSTITSAVAKHLKRRDLPEEKESDLTQLGHFQTILAQVWVGNPYDTAHTNARPYDVQEDWGRDNAVLKQILQRLCPKLIVEVGVWKGCSAIAMANALRSIDITPTVVAIDTWGGVGEWMEWVSNARSERGVPIIAEWWAEQAKGNPKDLSWPGSIDNFYQFANNIVAQRLDGVVLPMPIDGRYAASWLSSRGVKPDLVHLDATHDYRECLELAHSYWSLLGTRGVLMGTDYHLSHSGVMQAVHDFSKELDVAITFRGNVWLARK